jgi:hypothetical protein
VSVPAGHGARTAAFRVGRGQVSGVVRGHPVDLDRPSADPLQGSVRAGIALVGAQHGVHSVVARGRGGRSRRCVLGTGFLRGLGDGGCSGPR